MEKTTMTVQELSVQLGISIPKAYELTKTPGFPSIRIGTRIIIPIDEYKKWLQETSKSKEGVNNGNI
jgi:excisionase family DNA binding protein